LLDRALFEEVLETATDVPVGIAGDEPSASAETSPALEDLAQAVSALLAAARRLQQNPSLFSGDPDGVFTYEDPILAVAALWARSAGEFDERIFSSAATIEGANLRKRAAWHWMVTGVRAWLSRHDHARLLLAGKTPTRVISVQKKETRIAVLGDAGFKGAAQDTVIRLMKERHAKNPFDLVIHLGDVYFAGSSEEILKNLLAPLSSFSNSGAQVLTLLGNHDLYYGASGYHAALSILNQPGRYFEIDLPGWTIACLDTSLAAERVLGADAKLDDGQLEWLETILSRKERKRLVLMSHHYLTSSWEKPAASLKTQLQGLIAEKAFAWYWGHEHSCVQYGHGAHGLHGACVGNGAFLERWRKPVYASPELGWYPISRCNCYRADGPHFWPHGYVELLVTSGKITENYFLEGGEKCQRILKA
jgi:hypothetical protein